MIICGYSVIVLSKENDKFWITRNGETAGTADVRDVSRNGGLAMRRKGLTACGLSVLLAFGLMACGASQNGEEQAKESVDTDAAAKEDAAVGMEEESGTEEKPADLDFSVNYDGIKTAKIEAGVSVHDPSIYKADGKYYIFTPYVYGCLGGSAYMDVSGGRLQGEGPDIL